MSRLGITRGALVVVSLHSPREKYWGVLLQTAPAGVVVRGIDVNAFQDWLQQEAGRGDAMLGPSTIFFPMARLERMEADLGSGPIPGLAEVFRQKTGKAASRALGLPPRRGRVGSK